MKTEAEVKSQVTPEVIKKMCELAEGFELSNSLDIEGDIYFDNKHDDNTGFNILNITESEFYFPLLIHRAVEGAQIICIDYEDKYLYHLKSGKHWHFEDYQPETLTACECALLDCLCEVLK